MTSLRKFAREAVLLASAVFIWGSLYIWWPASWWLQVNSIRVFDAPQGTCPVMDIQGRLVRPFISINTVEVRELTEAGPVFVDSNTVTILVTPDNGLPAVPTLRWWMHDGEDVCNLKPGRYLVTSHFTIVPEWYPWMPVRFVNFVSEPFNVLPAEPA